MSKYHCPDASVIQALKDVANRLRIHSIKMTNASNSGHPTSCCSMAEIMSVLYFHTMRYKVEKPKDPANDRFVLSKGHAAPILYAACAEAGIVPVDQLLNLRKITSDLEGHPTPRLNFIDVATGSLGQGLSCAAGMAYVGKYIDKADYRVYCLIGDGESAEGSIWEAIHFASYYKLDNLVLIIDINRLGQSQATSLGHDIQTYHKRVEAFGWHAIDVDGHDVEALCKSFDTAATVKEKPTCILAKTFKGKNCPGIEDQDNWHGKALGNKEASIVDHIQGLIVNKTNPLKPKQPTANVPQVNIKNITLSEPPSYKKDEQLATRAAYGNALVKIGKNNNRVMALDGDMKNSTFSNKFLAAFPDRFIECFIAEQNMVGVATGCVTRDRAVAFVSTFASFMSRAYDQLRMGGISMTNINLVGSHAGISIGEDGPSQMALEDLAMFRAIPGSTVFYPSDAVSTEYAVQLAANTPGICFIRVSRPNTPILYNNNETFSIGKLKVVRQSSTDKVTVIGACVTLVEALKAADELAATGVNIRVVDLFTIKPIDKAELIKNARATGGKIITVEDHYPEGGIGEAVAAAVGECHDIIVKRLAVNDLPRSGKPAELLEMFGISAKSIVKAVQSVLSM